MKLVKSTIDGLSSMLIISNRQQKNECMKRIFKNARKKNHTLKHNVVDIFWSQCFRCFRTLDTFELLGFQGFNCGPYRRLTQTPQPQLRLCARMRRAFDLTKIGIPKKDLDTTLLILCREVVFIFLTL